MDSFTGHAGSPREPTPTAGDVAGSPWPIEEPAFRPGPEDIDDDTPLELDDEYWEALIPDDDYEPHPERGDFWTDDQ